jgi:hypothetical protein
MDAYSSSGRLVTILYTIHGVPEEEHDEDGTPNAFQVSRELYFELEHSVCS